MRIPAIRSVLVAPCGSHNILSPIRNALDEHGQNENPNHGANKLALGIERPARKIKIQAGLIGALEAKPETCSFSDAKGQNENMHASADMVVPLP